MGQCLLFSITQVQHEDEFGQLPSTVLLMPASWSKFLLWGFLWMIEVIFNNLQTSGKITRSQKYKLIFRKRKEKQCLHSKACYGMWVTCCLTNDSSHMPLLLFLSHVCCDNLWKILKDISFDYSYNKMMNIVLPFKWSSFKEDRSYWLLYYG